MQTRTDDPSVEIVKLRAEITRLTRRPCVSTNLVYLRVRVADLRARALAGELPNRKNKDPSAVVSVSTTRRRAELLAKICDAKKIGASQVMREAFDEWAKRNGFSVEIAHIHRMERGEVTS